MSNHPVVTQLLRFAPHNGVHRVAARAGVSVLVPLLLLVLLGRQEWTAYAAFGAFRAPESALGAAVAIIALVAIPDREPAPATITG